MNALEQNDSISRTSFRKIQKQTVTGDVEGQLRDAIISGQLVPGESLAEAQLATQFGVSRASVRQAKFQLASEGLLEFDSRGTALVRRLTEDDIREILEFREVLDVAAIRLACSRVSDKVLNALDLCIAKIERESDLLQLTLLDISFHEEVIRAARNSRLLAVWEVFRPQLVFWLAGMHRLHHSRFAKTQAITASSHLKLKQALQTGDVNLCEQIAREHAYGLKKCLDEVYANAGKNEVDNG